MKLGGNRGVLSALDYVLLVIAGILSVVMMTLTIGDAVANPQPVVAVLGDSYTKGSGEDSGKDSRWLAIVDKRLNLSEKMLAEGGAGYVHPNSGGKTFATRVKDVPSDADLVLVYGSLNDVEGYDAVKQAAGDLYATINTEAPGARVVVVGPTWPNTSPTPEVLASRDAVRDAAALRNLTFVDPIAEGWLAGSAGVIGGDGIHPNDKGHALLAEKLQPIVAAALPARD